MRTSMILTISIVLAASMTCARGAPAAAQTTAWAGSTSAPTRTSGASAPNARGPSAPSTRGGDEVDEAQLAGNDVELAGERVAVRGPSVGAVLTAAYAAAGLDRDPGRSWIRRARVAGLVPWVTVRTVRDTSWQDDQSEVGHSTSLELRATWRLDRLLFDGRELQVAALEASRRRERRRLATRVIRAYFTWRRAAGNADRDDDRPAPRVAEAAAELDALTDGWFSGELARLEHGAAETQGARR